jgi:hypothetical protein
MGMEGDYRKEMAEEEKKKEEEKIKTETKKPRPFTFYPGHRDGS